jgi:hypothetical protein
MNIRLDLRDLRSLKWATVPTTAQIRSAALEGMRRYQDFLQCTIGFDQRGVVCFAGDPVDYGGEKSDWVVWLARQNSILFNRDIVGRNKAGEIVKPKWTLNGITDAVTHELGHKYLWPAHVEWPLLNGGSHVMKDGAGSDYYGTFSPWEIYYFLRYGWKLNKRPVHPFARQYAANKDPKWKAANLAKLKTIVNSYGDYHAKLYAWQTTGVEMSMPDLPLPTGVCLGCSL